MVLKYLILFEANILVSVYKEWFNIENLESSLIHINLKEQQPVWSFYWGEYSLVSPFKSLIPNVWVVFTLSVGKIIQDPPLLNYFIYEQEN